MAEIVTIEGKQYVRRNPLGVLGLTLITLGIYGLYWYYKANEEIKNFTNDETISPVRSLMAFIFGWADHRPAVHRRVQHGEARFSKWKSEWVSSNRSSPRWRSSS
jgi:Domain of unknown function (DUF4234)